MTLAEKTIKFKELGPNASLIGCSDARHNLNTPALLLDLNALDRNIQKMALFACKEKIALRPHGKCHKSVAIARRQLNAGAVGLCCASVGEAEVMAAAGISDLLITGPLVTQAKIKRLCALASRGHDVKVVVDNPDNVQTLSVAAQSTDVELGILVDIDPGLNRTGVLDHCATVELAKSVNNTPHLKYCGLQCYAGNAQHIDDFELRMEKSLQALKKVATVRDLLASEGIESAILSGGGTGTFDIDAAAEVLTELQVGSYVFMDSQYNDVWLNYGELPPFEPALFVQSSVISANQPGFVTTDAGLKQFAVDGGEPIPLKGAPSGSRYHYFGDEHGRLELPDATGSLPLGARIECMATHCDPTVNLYNVVHCFRGDTLVDIWPIDARGA
ncbi:DSD1 family PLP-dependent enzyme [Pseudomaricurvus alkylphenolicus]|uniref:DSD1 family PLP-dependent enzyme n=1 Tax=Pseudomaricurvus alkylphenolicus TaxID=1306991 RepID=UPI001421AAA3|nr:DSD1 family PLP-dependent enzyme [Pseudomaricurvus alkylphenolicus]NIB38427.1 DSD1 family PLP-dependent enzyme [Pseudomaricurvus alkylphenolicus]